MCTPRLRFCSRNASAPVQMLSCLLAFCKCLQISWSPSHKQPCSSKLNRARNCEELDLLTFTGCLQELAAFASDQSPLLLKPSRRYSHTNGGSKRERRKHLFSQMSGLQDICGSSAKCSWCEGRWPLEYRILRKASAQSNLRANEHLNITHRSTCKKGAEIWAKKWQKNDFYATVYWNSVWNCVAPPHHWNLYAPLHYWSMRRRIIGDGRN
jgi:hypothetical protein